MREGGGCDKNAFFQKKIYVCHGWGVQRQLV